MPTDKKQQDPSFTTKNMSSNHDTILRAYDALKGRGLQLDLTRGKPCAEQLALSDELLSIHETTSRDGMDCRNYGCPEGLPEAQELFADYLGTTPSEVIVGGNSSLALMYDIVAHACASGIWTLDQSVDWKTRPKFICPAPGYDRHFAICEQLDITMIPVGMNADGPDMDAVAEHAKQHSVVGMWCVPKYSNPTGATYSNQVVRKLASMETANPNFRIFWDNAYAVHNLTTESETLLNIHEECRGNGTDDRVFIFGSTSKITYAGSGISAVSMSGPNLEWYNRKLACQTIGPDKINQLRHVLFLRNMENIREHMERHMRILQPKFRMALDVLNDQLSGTNLATWTKPNGGYFISLDVFPGCAKRVVELAAQAGVRLTPAGATFPYRKDPHDRNIRIAPSFLSVAEIQVAMQVLCLCIQIAATEKKK